MRHLTISVVLACLAAAGNVLALERGSIVLKNVAEKEEVFVDAAGVERTRLVPVATALPGDAIVYTVTFANVGEAPTESVAITNPVPEHMRYVDRSAVGSGTVIRFSVDGGKSYGAPDELFVVDDAGNPRPAEAEDYTHIRWQLLEDAAPGAEGFVRFTAVLN